MWCGTPSSILLGPSLSTTPGPASQPAPPMVPPESPLPDSAGSPYWLCLMFAAGSPSHPSSPSRSTPCTLCSPTSMTFLKLSPLHGLPFLPPWSQSSATLLEPPQWYLLQQDVSYCTQSPLPSSHLYVSLDWTVSCPRGPLS